MQPKTRLELIFSELDLSPLVKEIGSQSKRGPKGYDPASIIRALLAQQIENIPSRVKLVERLKTDPVFRYVCGFKVIGQLPSEATFSRYYTKLDSNNCLTDLFISLVNKTMELDLTNTETIAIDATDLTAYERPKPKNKVDKNNPNTPNWGAKYDSHRNKKTWFGWKLHLAVDTESELPLAFRLSPANESDGDYALPLVDEIHHFCLENEYTLPENWVMDSGYDRKNIYEKIYHKYSGQAFIPINKRNADKPPTGFYDFNGTPECSCGFKMVYWGCEKNFNKFRCPHVMKKVDCPYGSAWCSDSNYGYVKKTRIKDNPRFISIPHRGTKNWIKIYNKRTSVERCFGRLKENLSLDNLKVMGAKKVKIHVLLNLISMISCKLVINSITKAEQLAA